MIDACYHTLLDSLNYKTLYQSSKCLTVGDYMLRSPSSRFHLLILDLLDFPTSSSPRVPHHNNPPLFRPRGAPRKRRKRAKTRRAPGLSFGSLRPSVSVVSPASLVSTASRAPCRSPRPEHGRRCSVSFGGSGMVVVVVVVVDTKNRQGRSWGHKAA